jgi:uncharacterized membrane protein
LIKKRQIHTAIFVVFDAVAAGISWALFFAYRKYIIESDKFGYKIPV